MTIYPSRYDPIEIERPSGLLNHSLGKDILIDNKTFLDHYQVSKKIPIIPFRYISMMGLLQPFVDNLIEIAPKQLKLKPTKTFPTNILLLKVQNKGCKSFYELLSTSNTSNILWQQFYNHWTDILKIPLKISNWNNLILSNGKDRLNNNLREMQILFYHNKSKDFL